MPGRILPTFTVAEVESHNSTKSCYIRLGNNVYDVTDFLDSHPGGPGLILDYAGKDVADILKDEVSHLHSETAYEILDDSIVGFLPPANGNGLAVNGKAKSTGREDAVDTNGEYVHPRTGMSCEEDLSKETDYGRDYQKHQFLDLGKPLFLQVWNGGFSKEFYLDQIHRPRHYRGGESAPLFGNFLEPLSKTPWWLVPTLWVPGVVYSFYVGNQGLPTPLHTSACWLFGVFAWTLMEYLLHRFVFHLEEYLPDNRVGITTHFLLHGIHHYLPMDKYRLVLPPALFLILAVPFWQVAHAVFFWDWYKGTAAFSGGLFGYICYDLTHYFLHHENLPGWYRSLKKYHLQHHFLDYNLGFGVSSRFWDQVFGTELVDPVKTK